jgi:hypothetical protein
LLYISDIAIEHRDAFLKTPRNDPPDSTPAGFCLGAVLRSRAFLLSAIGVNRMRHENADAHEKKKPCCNIQHRTGSKARPYVGNMYSSVGRRLATTFRPSVPRSPCRSRSCALAPIGLSSLMVGLIVAARWLEKAGFEAHTGVMAESNRRSCYCRAVYHRTQVIAVSCEVFAGPRLRAGTRVGFQDIG